MHDAILSFDMCCACGNVYEWMMTTRADHIFTVHNTDQTSLRATRLTGYLEITGHAHEGLLPLVDCENRQRCGH